MNPYFKTERGMLFHGDCVDLMSELEPLFDFIITDPPYGCQATTGWGGKYTGFNIAGDNDTSLRDWVIEKSNVPIIMFGSPRVKRPQCKAVLIWNKGRHTGMGDLSFPWKPDYEEIYIIGEGFSGKRTSSVLCFNARIDSGRHHPTEKPVGLIMELLLKCPDGVAFDPFFGSGTLGVACERTGRRWIGIEKEEKYCEIAAKRIFAEASQLKLF